MTAIPAREAYRSWAPVYDEENVVSALDQLAVSILTPHLDGLALLDAGCGTARRLVFADGAAPRRVAGIDLVFEMILQSRDDPRRTRVLAVGDIGTLPVATATFDVVWCRLAAGHIRDVDSVYRELSRATRSGGVLIVTDFHPDAVRHGHVRSYRDERGELRVVEHVVHEPADHDRAARRAGLDFDARVDLRIGPGVRDFYERAGAATRYERDRGLPLVLGLRYRR